MYSSRTLPEMSFQVKGERTLSNGSHHAARLGDLPDQTAKDLGTLTDIEAFATSTTTKLIVSTD
jgi:hypothetical protein